ncbi:hypothetical protein [Streptomyces sp. AM8-1-1]|uniref:hypothetical protein n=1 Tax=Streptomyces sp. AM8-1-1 TaxID=3075825 RepID=UPI0028C39403|nr:hypothetical protein [Streptomyces sp. AM8-1-1]WNO71754.1 hypothetical protein RPQ07_08950 [Streptomyces sp. AM8-1-1]
MFDRLEIRVLPRGPRWAAQVRFLVNGEDIVHGAVNGVVGEGGRGPFAQDALPVDRPSPFRATGEARRLFFGETACTAGCCGALSAVVQRTEGVVCWTDWEAPRDETPPLDLHFLGTLYDAELARAEADRSWRTDTTEQA